MNICVAAVKQSRGRRRQLPLPPACELSTSLAL
jgi:hypothetical protein